MEPIQWALWAFLGRMPLPPTRQPQAVSAGRGRSLFLRHLDCGSCNGCELALHALNTPQYDLPGKGIHFVASPRHADVVVMTGPLTYNMVDAALATLEQMPAPRIIAVGDCAIHGGPFRDAYGVVPVVERPRALTDPIIKRIAGCPPSPEKILQALFDITLQSNTPNHPDSASHRFNGFRKG